MTVENGLLINDTPIKQLPNNLKVGCLIISEEQLKNLEFPTNMVCGGYSAGTPMGMIPGYVFRNHHIRVVTDKDETCGDLHMALDDYEEYINKKEQTPNHYPDSKNSEKRSIRERIEEIKNVNTQDNNILDKANTSPTPQQPILPNEIPSSGFNQSM